MEPKANKNIDYEFHGNDVDSMRVGFEQIGMPNFRWEEAGVIVKEVLEANAVRSFYWYKVANTDELACYWNDATKNLLWVQRHEVHVLKEVVLPARPIDYVKSDGELVGWLLPGGSTGTGGGPVKAGVAEVLCPATFLWIPKGVECEHCGVIH